MGIRKLLTEVAEDAGRYIKGKNAAYLQEFLRGYCIAKEELSGDDLDARFSSYFTTWLPLWIEENITTHPIMKRPYFEGLRELLPKGKEEFIFFLELCELCIRDYDDETGYFSWRKEEKDNNVDKQRSRKENDWHGPDHSPLKYLLLYSMRIRPQMYAWNLRMDLFYYLLSGRCLAYRSIDILHDEIDEMFCQWFGEWLSIWIQENIDEKYISDSKFWYEDIIRITPQGKEALLFFLELCDLFFDDYYNASGYFNWKQKTTIEIEMESSAVACMGYGDIIVSINGRRYKLQVFSMETLQKTFENVYEIGGFYNSSPNMILVKETSRNEIEKTIQKLFRLDYFKRILPL